MLVPPRGPILRKRDPGAWKLISTNEFDGRAEDHFNHTTLHLSFTDYTSPIYDGIRGGQDSQVCFLESVVSIHDKGDWVGDIDVLRAVNSPSIKRLPQEIHCNHEKGQKPARVLTSIESWDEMLDPPRSAIIIRANGNWIARVAATAVLIQVLTERNLGSVNAYILICPSSVCWQCEDPPERASKVNFALELPGLRRIYLY